MKKVTSDELRGTRDEGGAGALFKRSMWGETMNYECALCAYATLEAGRMQDHLRAAHGVVMGGAATADGTAATAGGTGEPIILIEEGEVR